jgi:regulator of protease activity HflC (stomatin/prohibitin superfamily)
LRGFSEPIALLYKQKVKKMEEQNVEVLSGWPMLCVTLLFLMVEVFLFLNGIVYGHGLALFFGVIGVFGFILMTKGFFTLQPNEARLLILFGKYRGTVKKDGFHWANPFTVHRGSVQPMAAQSEKGQTVPVHSPPKYRVSLRARNFETDTLKVNDLRGNPIEIGAVVVWRVKDTAKALFDVDEYEHYVHVQSESAVRHLANTYPYDHSDDSPEKEITLRDSTDAISAALEKELQERLLKAGVVIDEARLTHLAYAPEIAGAMLRRQQAEAIIAARKKIVHGAVSMVEMALDELSEKNVVELDNERKAAMVGNLLVVLCGETQAEPVINTTSLTGK